MKRLGLLLLATASLWGCWDKEQVLAECVASGRCRVVDGGVVVGTGGGTGGGATGGGSGGATGGGLGGATGGGLGGATGGGLGGATGGGAGGGSGGATGGGGGGATGGGAGGGVADPSVSAFSAGSATMAATAPAYTLRSSTGQSTPVGNGTLSSIDGGAGYALMPGILGGL